MKGKDLRKPFKNEMIPCYVCGKHRSITQAHHVVPLKDCAAILENGNEESINVPIIWLCPNCHSYVHKQLRIKNYKNRVDVLREVRTNSITEEEFERIYELADIPPRVMSGILKINEVQEFLDKWCAWWK